MDAEITELKYKIRSSISKDPSCYDYEEFEIAVCPLEGANIAELCGQLKLTLWEQCTQEPGTPKDKPAGGISKGGSGGRSSVDWDSMYCKYDIPFKPPVGAKWTSEQVRGFIKDAGGRFRGKKNRDGSFNPDGDNCWYLPRPLEKAGFLEQYCTVLNPVEKPGSDDDDEELPF